MKKTFAFLGTCLLLAGVKAQTGHPAKKETTQPAVTGTVKNLPPSNPNDKHKGEAPAFHKAPSQIKAATVKPVPVTTTPKKKNG